MSEQEVLQILIALDQSQRDMIAQVISLHLVMAAAVFYFLHRAGLAMKLAVFVLYALGNAMYVALMYNASLQVVGAREQLQAIASAGQASPITLAVLRATGEAWNNAASIITNASFLALWLGAIYFLFFWKRPAEAD